MGLKLNSVFEGILKNFKRMCLWHVLKWSRIAFCKRNKEIFLQPCSIVRQLKYAVYENGNKAFTVFL